MRYYAQYNDDKLISISTGYGDIEITEEEYNRLLAEIHIKVELVNKLYNEEIALAEVPAKWQEEIQRRVDERIAAKNAIAEEELSTEEALDIILGGEVE